MSKHHKARKRFGQNFLQDNQIIERIIDVIHPSDHDKMIEIGPGLGAITQHLVSQVEHLHVIEIDRDLVVHLQKQFQSHKNLSIHSMDALKCELNTLATTHEKYRIVGNLPYNISTPLIFHLLKQIDYISDMHFMLQKEVVDRMAAKSKTKAYSRLSVMVQYYCQVDALFDVPNTAFDPIPKVTSAIVKLTPDTENHHKAVNEALFADIVRLAFHLKRKTLRNNLKSVIKDTELEQLNIDPNQRAEQLPVADFVTISNFLANSRII